MRKTIVFFSLLIALSLIPACENGAKAEGVQGTYSAVGTNPDGSPYRGTVVVEKQEDKYRFQWNIAGQSQTGEGELKGDQLIVDWGQQHPVIYEVQENGARLEGTWADGKGREVLTR